MIDRREFTLAAALLPAAFPVRALSEIDAASGVRAALERGALAAVALLGKTDGFLGNALVRIPLPPAFDDAAKVLKTLGQQKKLDELVTSMNRAAEAAVPVGKAVLVKAVKALTVEDALEIVRGGETSVTEFFSGKTRAPLGEQFLPIVTKATERVKVVERYNAIAERAASLGLMKGDATNVQRYVTGKAVDGLFVMIAQEEKKIRADPVRTGSALLRRVFGG
jgi:hypothetical protein